MINHIRDAFLENHPHNVGSGRLAGRKRLLNAEKLKKYVTDFDNSQFFLCGPPVMMSNVVKALKVLGVPKRRIHYERFALR